MASVTDCARLALVCLFFSQGLSLPVDGIPRGGDQSNGKNFFMSSHGSQFYSSSSNGGNVFVSSSNNLIVTSPGSDITISCGFYNPSNNGNVHWTKKTGDGHEVPLSERYYSGSPMNIRLRNVSESDSGIYTCYVGSDPHGVQKTELKVTNSQGYHWTPEQMEQWRNFNPLPPNFHQDMSNMASHLNRELSQMNSQINRETVQMQAQLNQEMSQMRHRLENMFHH